MAEGAGQGRRPELSGGGILRRLKAGEDLGGLKEELSDRRVWGDGDFVERVLRMGGGERRVSRLSGEEILSRVAKGAGISPVELGSGSKRPPVVGGGEDFFLCSGSPGRDDDGSGGEVDKGNAVGSIEIGLEG